MDKPLTLAKIITDCSTGGYVGGEVFKNQLGQEIYFDGNCIKGLTEINPNDTWEYVEGRVFRDRS